MATPGGIGVYLTSGPSPARVNERPWRGVYHHWGGQPDDLGAELIKRARLFKGNLGGLVRQVIDSAPRGWSSLAQQTQLDDDGSTAGPDDTGNIAYAYVFDVGARRLDCFATHADANGEFIGAVTFDAQGAATPPQFEVVEPPSPLLAPQVLPSWTPSTPENAAFRASVRARVERDCAAAGLTVRAFVDAVALGLSETLFHAAWGKRAPAPLTRVIVPGARVAWSVLIGSLEVLYPPAGSRRSLRTKLSGEKLGVFLTPENDSAELDVRRSVVTAHLGEGAKTAYDILISALPASDWLYAFLDLARGLMVPELEQGAAAGSTELPWRVFTHADGRVWAIRSAKGRYILRLGARDDDPVFRERPSAQPEREVDQLIKEQLRDGFVPAPDEPV